LPDAFLRAAGYHEIAGRAVRLDMLDRLEDELEKGAVAGATAENLIPKLVSFLGCDRDSLEIVLDDLGWHPVDVAGSDATAARVLRQSSIRPDRQRHRPTAQANSKSPFASLNSLIATR
jgi:ATP-dependent RNA helicase SUPV3L1/SUV3